MVIGVERVDEDAGGEVAVHGPLILVGEAGTAQHGQTGARDSLPLRCAEQGDRT